jgi:hypothetical protein
MTLEQNKQAVLEAFRVIETGDNAMADRIIAPDFINREADDDPNRPDGGLRGPASLIATSRWFSETFSDSPINRFSNITPVQSQTPARINLPSHR